MRKQEAAWIGERLRELASARVVLNLGSGSRHFRIVSKPYIDRQIFDPLVRRGARIVHADLKGGEGIDIRGDVSEPAVQSRRRELRPDAILAYNIMEPLPQEVRSRFAL